MSEIAVPSTMVSAGEPGIARGAAGSLQQGAGRLPTASSPTLPAAGSSHRAGSPPPDEGNSARWVAVACVGDAVASGLCPNSKVTAMRVVAMVLALATAMLGLSGNAGAQGSAGAIPQPDPCARTSWLAGTTELCEGVLIYRDYVMDDYGAGNRLNPTSETVLLGSLSPTAGDQRYDDPSKAGTADLIDLAMWIDGDRLHAVFEVNALYEADSTIAALAIDTDNDPSTGGGEWPGLGISSAGWEVLEQVNVGDPETNTLSLSMPVPAGSQWRVQAVTAKADGTVMNVAFRGTDEISGLGQSTWWEGKQAAALDGGNIDEFFTQVAVGDLRNGVTRRADHTAPGYHLRVHTSAHTIGTGEGYSYEPEFGRHGDSGSVCEQEFVSFGRYQPYSVYVPNSDTPKGLQVYLHGCNANHSSQIDGEGFQTQFGDDLDRVIIAPLGRGPVGYYSDISEVDVFEAAEDAHVTYGLDRRRWFLSGYSMGGYGTLRLGTLYPHLWAGLTNWVGFTGDGGNNPTGTNPSEYPSGAIGNAIDFVGNLQWVPSEHLYAGADELVHSTSATALSLRLASEGVDHEWYFHPLADHLTFVLLDQWRKEAEASQGRTVARNPPRVKFRTDADLAYPEYDINPDTAYWVSHIRPVAEGYSDVDLITGACAGELPVRESGQNAGPQPVPWTSTSLRTTGAEPIEDRPALSGTLDNVASLTIDTAASCLAYRPIAYRITSDQPVAVSFSDGRTLRLTGVGEHSGTVPANRPCDPAPTADIRDRSNVRTVHRASVDCVIFTQISVGIGDRRYGPASMVTRGQMATFLVNALHAAGAATRLPQAGDDAFADITASVHRENINRLAAAELVSGRGGRFSPDTAITREQMATFMANAARFAGVDLPPRPGDHFGDVARRSVHHGNINAGFASELFSGVTPPTEGVDRSGRFAPARSVARDQMASFLVNLLRAATSSNE
jgi:hypothetical protein